MSALSEYFAAPSDTDAAAVISTGPLRQAPIKPRRFLRPKRAAAPTVVSGAGIDPVVQIGHLQSLLTGASFDSILAAAPTEPVALEADGERFIVRLVDGVVAALAAANEDVLVAVAQPWSETEEFFGSARPEDLVPFISSLATLARYASAESQQIYCWYSV